MWATKKFGRKTGWKCIQCHQSKKGGDKNLKEEGKNYLRYIQIRKNIRKARKDKKKFEIGSDEKEIVNFFKSVHKKLEIIVREMTGVASEIELYLWVCFLSFNAVIFSEYLRSIGSITT